MQMDTSHRGICIDRNPLPAQLYTSLVLLKQQSVSNSYTIDQP